MLHLSTSSAWPFHHVQHRTDKSVYKWLAIPRRSPVKNDTLFPYSSQNPQELHFSNIEAMASSSRSSQNRRTVRTDILQGVRILDQSAENPRQVVVLSPTSRTFRIMAFALHCGLSLLETTEGTRALARVGRDVYNEIGRRARRNIFFQGDLGRHPQLMDEFASGFIARCRADPPNIIVSDRLYGEGLTQRLNWRAISDDYSAKWGALYRINKVVSCQSPRSTRVRPVPGHPFLSILVFRLT